MATSDVSTPPAEAGLEDSSPAAELVASLNHAMKAAAIRACYKWAAQQRAAGVSEEEILKTVALQVLEEG